MICHIVNNSYYMHLVLYHTGYTTQITSLNPKLVGVDTNIFVILAMGLIRIKKVLYSCMGLIPFISSMRSLYAHES